MALQYFRASRKYLIRSKIRMLKINSTIIKHDLLAEFRIFFLISKIQLAKPLYHTSLAGFVTYQN